MRGTALTEETRERAVSIVIAHPAASINKLAELTDLPHGTIANIRAGCVKRGLVRPLRDEDRLTPGLQHRIVNDYKDGFGVREVSHRVGVSYYAVRLVLSIHDVELRAPARPSQARVNGAGLPIGGDVLDVLCWCEESVVLVEREKVLGGETRSCGRPECRMAS